MKTLKYTRIEEGQTGLQRLKLNLQLKVVDLHGAEDLAHGHVRLIQTGHPADTETCLNPTLNINLIALIHNQVILIATYEKRFS